MRRSVRLDGCGCVRYATGGRQADKKRGLPLAVRILPFSLLRMWRSGTPFSREFCALEAPMLARTSTNAREDEGSAPDRLPAIVVKAQEDARCRSALMDMGYSIVRSEYVRQRREGLTAFDGLGALRPTLVFVQDWLQEERRRIIARTWLPFLLTMLATILAGLSFALVAAMLS